MDLSEIASAAGVSESTALEWLRRGCPAVSTRPLVFDPRAVADWLQGQGNRRSYGKLMKALIPAVGDSTPVSGDAVPESPDRVLKRKQAELANEKIIAQRLANDEVRRVLIRRSVADDAIREMLLSLRAEFSSLAVSVAGRLAGRSAPEISEAIADSIDGVFREVGKRARAMLSRPTPTAEIDTDDDDIDDADTE